MRLWLRGLVLVALVTVAVGIAVAGQDNPLATPPVGRAFTPSEVIYPDQVLPLRFFHDKHLAQEIDCTTCHEPALESVSASDVLVPVGFEGEDQCTLCHDFEAGAEAEPVSACTTCHPGYDPAFPPGADKGDTRAALTRPPTMVIPTPNLKMNHKVHADKGIKCVRCHGEMTDIQLATRENALPLMNTCLECHDGKQAPDECRTCHLAKPNGQLINHFPQGVLKPEGRFRNDAHDDNWLNNHAATARQDDAYCANCHEPKYCLDCHNGVAKPFKIHPNNWALLHPLAARRNVPDCSSCHRAQSFCTDCHKRSKVVVATEFPAGRTGQAWNNTKLGRFHPPGWTDTIANDTARGPNHHSFQAQRNIRVCASCHTEQTCLTCHKSNSFQGVGVNPHPPAFGASLKCKRLRATNQRMCAKCHGPVVPECR